MSDQFTAEVLPVVHKYAVQRFRGDEYLVTVAESLAWYIWRTRREDWPPSVYAHLAARQVSQGRDLPGCATRAKDALRHSTSGGGMGELMDGPAAEPLATLIGRERLEVLLSIYGNDPVKGEVLRMLLVGDRTLDVADEMGLSPARISQLRREFLEAADGE